MNGPSRFVTPNPHLGAYYGIVTSAFVSLIVLLAMFEQLGWSQPCWRETMMLVPLALYLVIAVGSRTLQPEDFFVSGRRVPPVYNGVVLAAVAVGGAGFFAYTGTLFFLGFDGARDRPRLDRRPVRLRRFCSARICARPAPTRCRAFLGHRFRSRGLRMAASVMQLPPTALLLAAEIKIAALIAVAVLAGLVHLCRRSLGGR